VENNLEKVRLWASQIHSVADLIAALNELGIKAHAEVSEASMIAHSLQMLSEQSRGLKVTTEWSEGYVWSWDNQKVHVLLENSQSTNSISFTNIKSFCFDLNAMPVRSPNSQDAILVSTSENYHKNWKWLYEPETDRLNSFQEFWWYSEEIAEWDGYECELWIKGVPKLFCPLSRERVVKLILENSILVSGISQKEFLTHAKIVTQEQRSSIERKAWNQEVKRRIASQASKIIE